MLKNSDHISKTDSSYCLNNTNTVSTDYGNNISFMSSSQGPERYVWEIRARSPNITPVSTVLNSPDLNTDMVQYGLHPHQRKVQQIRVGRSPGSQFDDEHDILPQQLTSPDSPTDVSQADTSGLRDGEIVVFDDIDTNWMNKTSSNYQVNRTNHRIDVLQSNEDVLKVTKMIGQLPIAEYEGSPRRFGNQSLAKKSFPKKPPGFPQRISPLSGITVQKQQQQQQQQQQQYQQQQEVAHARHQQMQRQHQFYAQATSSGVSGCGNSPGDENNESANDLFNSVRNISDSTRNLIDMEGDGVVVVSTATKSRTKTPALDYLYEFSETRKVLEEFFKANADDENRFIDFPENPDDFTTCVEQQDQQNPQVSGDCEPAQSANDNKTHISKSYIGQRLARLSKEKNRTTNPPTKQQVLQQPSEDFPQQMSKSHIYKDHLTDDLYNDSNSRSSGDLADADLLDTNLRRHSRNFTLSPETTDYDSNCGDLDSLSNDMNCVTDFSKMYTSMPVLEDGLSSGHASDTENNCQIYNKNNTNNANDNKENNDCNGTSESDKQENEQQQQQEQKIYEQNSYNSSLNSQGIKGSDGNAATGSEVPSPSHFNDSIIHEENFCNTMTLEMKQVSPGRSSNSSHQTVAGKFPGKAEPIEIQEAMQEIRSAIQRAKTQSDKMKICNEILTPDTELPIWLPRNSQTEIIGDDVASVSSRNKTPLICDEDEQDTDLETDRLLGQQRNDDTDFFEDKQLWSKTSRVQNSSNNSIHQSPSASSDITMLSSNSINLKQSTQSFATATVRQNTGTSLASNSPAHCSLTNDVEISASSPSKLNFQKSPTDSIKSLKDSVNSDKKSKSRHKEEIWEPAVLIEGVLFRARYLGSTQLICEGQPTKSTRMMQAEEAVSRIKAPEGEHQPSTEVDLFISTEKIMVLNTDLKEIMMDHALRTISYIADIGDLVVLMARRRYIHSDPYNANVEGDTSSVKDKEIKENDASVSASKHATRRTPKMICHVFESDEAQFIAQSIGQAFQVAYMEFLKANGIENENLAKEMDYQEVLNSQEIFGDELEIFAKKELQKEVVVPKAKGEILGVVIVESGWGSMLPTVVIANLMSGGAAARCGQLNIGDQLIAINGLSLVGLPLSTCQSYIRNAKNQTAVKFTVVPCPPVVEVKILRPKALFQLGFSVQNGVICSLLRGGIAERGGVRVGHRIIEINNQSVVAVPHDTIVKLLSSSVGEILMKTMPTSMFRLLTGQETPIYI